MTTTQVTSVVGLGEYRVSTDPTVTLTCLGLGSCVAVAAYDPMAKVAGMAHIVLPDSEKRDSAPSAKFADQAVPMLLEEMRNHDAIDRRLVVKIVGGSQMSGSPSAGALFKTGMRNIDAVRAALSKARLKIVAEEVGGSVGRSMRLFVGSGKVTISVAGSRPREL